MTRGQPKQGSFFLNRNTVTFGPPFNFNIPSGRRHELYKPPDRYLSRPHEVPKGTTMSLIVWQRRIFFSKEQQQTKVPSKEKFAYESKQEPTLRFCDFPVVVVLCSQKQLPTARTRASQKAFCYVRSFKIRIPRRDGQQRPHHTAAHRVGFVCSPKFRQFAWN